MSTEKKQSEETTDRVEEEKTTTEDFGSEHLNEAFRSFSKGLTSLGLFCTEQAIPVAEQAARDGMDNLDELLSKARQAMDEAFTKAHGEATGNDENDDNDSKSGEK